MKRMAETLTVFLCDHCAAVHIGFWRKGEMFAEAIPDDIEAVARRLEEAVEESRQRRRAGSAANH